MHVPRQTRIIIAGLALGLLATAGFASGAAAAPRSSKPVVAASVGSLTGAVAPISYTVNRGAKQVASATYSLNGGDPLGAPAPTSVTKSSSAGTFTVTAAEGANSLTVTVTLTDGGTATSNQVTFTYTADPLAATRSGCEALAGGTFTMGDDPSTTIFTEAFYCTTTESGLNTSYYYSVFGPSCTAYPDAPSPLASQNPAVYLCVS
jgi:hypothetical protein